MTNRIISKNPIYKNIDYRTKEGKKLKKERDEAIISLRLQGFSYKHIGLSIGVSPDAASMVCWKARVNFTKVSHPEKLKSSLNKANKIISSNNDFLEKDKQKKIKYIRKKYRKSIRNREHLPWHISKIDLSNIPHDLLEEQRKELNAKNFLYKDEKWIIRLDKPLENHNSNREFDTDITLADTLQTSPESEIEEIMMANGT